MQPLYIYVHTYKLFTEIALRQQLENRRNWIVKHDPKLNSPNVNALF